MATLDDALLAPPPAEVPLREAPLVHVIAQARFPRITAIATSAAIAPVQEALRSCYPVLVSEQTQQVRLGATGAETDTQHVWRFFDESTDWRVSVAEDFVALETLSYKSRADFVNRWREILVAVEQHLKPGRCDRLGVRYLDRLANASIQQFAELVRPELLGVAGLHYSGQVILQQSEAVFELEGANLRTRWGLVPPGATVDAGFLEPLDQPSWILDLDMGSTAGLPFAADQLIFETERYAARSYAFFRWAVTETFLQRFSQQEKMR